MNKEYLVSALLHIAVFVVFMLVGNWIFHFRMNGVAILIGGVLYGFLMAWLDRVLEKRKNK